jgi:hypothetical protein
MYTMTWGCPMCPQLISFYCTMGYLWCPGEGVTSRTVMAVPRDMRDWYCLSNADIDPTVVMHSG